MLIFILLYIYSLIQVTRSEDVFKNITAEVFGKNIEGIISAFGDFNSDTLTDVFILTDNGTAVEILLGQPSTALFNRSDLKFKIKAAGGSIVGIVPADYNGDSKMDILLVKRYPNNSVNIYIVWADNLKAEPILVDEMNDEPLVLDSNADMIPDLFAEDVNKSRCFWISSASKTFNKTCLNNTDTYHFTRPHSNAFLDLTQDFNADLFITSQNSTGKKYFEVWDLISKNCIKMFDLNSTFIVVGQSAFLDIDANGNLELIVAVCENELCLNSSKILVHDFIKNKWFTLPIDFQNTEMIWGFLPLGSHNLTTNTLRIGDYNMDGYPDILAVLHSSGEQRAFLLENIPSHDSSNGRSFKILWNAPVIKEINDVVIATFYDIQEDGILDILLVSQAKGSPAMMHAIQNSFITDAYFIKVIVLSGLCYSDCADNKIPYGINQPGPMIEFRTTLSDGSPLNSCAAQLSQSAYFALQLPYTVFGLGTTPNFVEVLQIGVPNNKTEMSLKHEWNSIIPNSQLTIVPYPHSKPNKWICKLFVTPSRLMLMTLAALGGTCIVLIGIIGFLHWKEKRADRREKLQEAHRFHFDAM